MILYWKRSRHEVEYFYELMREFSHVKFFQPSPDRAPWHVQARLPNGELINFWPHARKAMLENEPPVSLDPRGLLIEALARPPVDTSPLVEDDDEAPPAPLPDDDDTIPF